MAVLNAFVWYLPLRFGTPFGDRVALGVVLAAVLVLVGLAVPGMTLATRRRDQGPVFALCVYFMWASTLTIVNYGLADSFEALRYYVLPIAAYFVGLAATTEYEQQRLLKGILLTAVAVSVFYSLDVAFFTQWTGRFLSEAWITRPEEFQWTELRPDRGLGWAAGVFGYPHPNGVFAAIGMIAAYYLSSQRSWMSAFWICCSALCAIPLVLGASKVSFLFAAGAIVLVSFRLRHRIRIAPAAITVVVFLALAVFFYINGGTHVEHTYAALNFADADTVSSYDWLGRELDLFSAFVASQPFAALLGNGFSVSDSGGRLLYISNDVWHFSLISEVGFVGYLIFLSLPIAAMWTTWRDGRTHRVLDELRLVAALMALLIMVASSHSRVLLFYGISCAYYCLLGMARARAPKAASDPFRAEQTVAVQRPFSLVR